MSKPTLTDLNTIPWHMRMDYQTRNRNLLAGKTLCRRCEGTGNEMFSMFRPCQACDGDGVSRGNEDQFED